MEAAHECVTGKTTWLVAEVEAYRAELAFDFRHLFGGLSISDIGETIPWWEAVDLLEQVAAHPGSHYWSKREGFTEPTTMDAVFARLQVQSVMNLLRSKDSEPIKVPLPIDHRIESDVTPEEHDALVAYAKATVPFSLDD